MSATGIFAFFFTCVLTYSLAFSPSHTDDEGEARIVGGFEDNKEDYPFVVSLRGAKNNHFCGGTLINHEYVITAAHCVVSGHEKYVVIGSDSLDRGGTLHKVISIHVHPDYDPKLVRNDIAILQIEKETTYKSSFPARMQTNLSDYENPCYVMGWGLTEAGGNLSNKFKIAPVQPVNPKKCEEEWKEMYNPRLICTSSEGNAACHGDSGGPLICENKFAGIVSFGKPCATRKPDAFTAVSCYNDWIDSIIH
ncbi:hypothetical protein Zmor_013519 [Zophobas morio]|uniref:Peptidase S1 domain-containing protein n=1 Tax=Zophobas morio TaxID=2755281 RepID=A0AA38MFS1_9CUCU|nr:hypothetical protein Zmor_013519 [Zophobas morio]